MNLCEYGCGQEATYQFKNRKWCCGKSGYSCPGVIEKRRRACLEKYGVDNISKSTEIKEKKKQTSLENYGVDNPNKSQEIKEKIKQTFLEKYGVDNPNKSQEIKEKTKQIFLEKYGVDHSSKLQEVQEKIKQTCLEKYGVDHPNKSQEVQEKRKQTCLDKYGVDHPSKLQEIKEKIKQIFLEKYDTHPNKLTIDKINEKYPFFSQIEEIRYNPDKPIEEKEIQVHCKYNECENSKEKDGWFTPIYSQLYERIRNVEKDYGNGGCYFYCSEECKHSCSLYKLQSDPNRNMQLPYTQEEYNTWRKVVLEQDNYECQKCGSKEDLHCHHINPVKLEPILALDPTNGIVLCEKCHYEIGHKIGTECSTGNLANKVCYNKGTI